MIIRIRERSKEICTVGDEYGDNHNAIWCEINGVSTNGDLQWANGKQISELFRTKVHLLHNPSQGLLVDLIECFRDRTLGLFTSISKRIAKALRKQLLKTKGEKGKKIILLAHSQGTIIASNAIELLMRENNPEVLEQLDRYAY